MSLYLYNPNKGKVAYVNPVEGHVVVHPATEGNVLFQVQVELTDSNAPRVLNRIATWGSMPKYMIQTY